MALAAARVAVWELDDFSGRLHGSDNIEALWSRTAVEMRQSSGFPFVHPEDLLALNAALAAARAGQAMSVDFRIELPDGGYRWLQATGRRSDADPTHLSGVVVDVSDRRQLEDQLRQAQKLEAIGQLAGGVAHDFNNLLTAMMGYAEMLSEELEGSHFDHACQILKAGDRARTLTRQLLTFSRHQVIDVTLVDVAAVANDLVKMLHRLLGEHVTLAVTLPPQTLIVRADRGHLEQLLTNLVVNARDAMPAGGRITVDGRRHSLAAETAVGDRWLAAGDYVVIGVRDNGTGMTQEVKRRLFEPFFTTKPVGRGTGLGLATVMGIVVQARGAVAVNSTLGRGTEFEVWLPASSGQIAAADPVARSQPRRVENALVLVVEDDEAVRFVAHSMLQRAGCRVLLAANPAEAQEIFRRVDGQVDALLSDIVMPGAFGPELYATLAAGNPALRVVYMSAYSDRTDFEFAELAADAAFLQKPFTADALLERLQQVLSR